MHPREILEFLDCLELHFAFSWWIKRMQSSLIQEKVNRKRLIFRKYNKITAAWLVSSYQTAGQKKFNSDIPRFWPGNKY